MCKSNPARKKKRKQGFAPRASTGLSQASIFGASLGGLAVNARARLPPDGKAGHGRPLIDYDAALYLAPLEMAGAVLGATAQRVLPDWLLLGAASGVLAATARRTAGRYAAMRDEERKGSEMPDPEGSPPGGDAEGGTGEASDGGYSRWHDDGDGGPRRWLLEADARQYPPEKIASLALLWTGLAAVTVLRGAGPPAGLFDCGDAAFVALLLAQFAWTLGFAAYQGRRIVASAAARVRAGYPFRDRDVRWDAAALRLYGAWTLLAGV